MYDLDTIREREAAALARARADHQDRCPAPCQHFDTTAPKPIGTARLYIGADNASGEPVDTASIRLALRAAGLPDSYTRVGAYGRWHGVGEETTLLTIIATQAQARIVAGAICRLHAQDAVLVEWTPVLPMIVTKDD